MRRRSIPTNGTPQPKKVVIVPAGTPEKTLKELRTNGYIPILTNAPGAVQILSPSVQSHDLLMAAMHALATATNVTPPADIFVKELARRLKAREAPATPPQPTAPTP